MKIFIPTYDRENSISTHLIFKDAQIIVHSKKQKEKYLKNNTINPDNLIISGVDADQYGLTRQREWIANNLVSKNEWFVFADDDIKNLFIVDEKYYNLSIIDFKIVNDNKYWNLIFSKKCTPKLFFKKSKELISIAKRENARMCGFATTNNFFFRAKKIRLSGYCMAGLVLMKNKDLSWDHTITMEDFRTTADHLLRFGSIIINNYIRPDSSCYKSGGMGPYMSRVEQRIIDVKKLMELYPGLFLIRKRKNFLDGSDLKLRIHSKKQIEKWRNDFGKTNTMQGYSF